MQEAEAVLARIPEATLEALQERFPEGWKTVGEALVEAAATAATGRPEAMAAFMNRFAAAARPWRLRVERARGRQPWRDGPGTARGKVRGGAAGRGGATTVLTAAALHLAMARMAHLGAEIVLEATAARLATGRATESLRFRRLDGWLIERLLFARRRGGAREGKGDGNGDGDRARGGLDRKPASLAVFRWVWPLVGQRGILMPLVGPRGIYCFYTRELVRALTHLVDGRACIEIAAGDGTLARFLRAAGTPVAASDDRSWSHVVRYPDDVEDASAATALARTRPAVVLCSFPPPGNDFERLVFETASVELYVVITSRHRFAAGDWSAYEAQGGFEWEASPELARLVLPPELEPTVLIFRRRPAARPQGASGGRNNRQPRR
jgi:hypothetical protein